MIVTDAGASRLHYAMAAGVLTIYSNGREVTRADDVAHMVQIARDCASGLLRLTVNGEAVQVVDHRWLLQLGGAALAGAAVNL